MSKFRVATRRKFTSICKSLNLEGQIHFMLVSFDLLLCWIYNNSCIGYVCSMTLQQHYSSVT